MREAHDFDAGVGDPGDHAAQFGVVGRRDRLAGFAFGHRPFERLGCVGTRGLPAVRGDSVIALECTALGDGAGRAEAGAGGGVAQQLEGALRRAERHAGVPGAEEADGGQVEPRRSALRIGPAEGQLERFGDEYVAHSVVRAARALQAHHVPAVLDFEGVGRGEDGVDARRARCGGERLPAAVELARAGQHPAAVADAAGEGPAAVEPLPAVAAARFAFRVRGARDARVGGPEDGVERVVGEVGGDQPGRHGLDHRAPAGGDIGAGELGEDFHLRGRVQRVAADLPSAGEGEHAALLKRVDRGGSESAQADRFGGVVGEDGLERLGALQPVAPLFAPQRTGSAHGAPPPGRSARCAQGIEQR